MRVVVAAEPGRLRDGLLAILDSFLTSGVVVVDDDLSALEAVRSEQTDLVILHADFGKDDAMEFVRDLKQERNGVPCIVVADSFGQFQPLLKAGVDKVLLKGFSAAELSTAVKELTAEGSPDDRQ